MQIIDLAAREPAECTFPTATNTEFKPVSWFNYTMTGADTDPHLLFRAKLRPMHVSHKRNGKAQPGTGLIVLGFNNKTEDYQADYTVLNSTGTELGLIIKSSASYDADLEWNTNDCSVEVTQQYTVPDLLEIGGTTDDTAQTLEGNVHLVSTAFGHKGVQLAKYMESVQKYKMTFPKTIDLLAKVGTIGVFGTVFKVEVIDTCAVGATCAGDITLKTTLLIENTIKDYSHSISDFTLDSTWSKGLAENATIEQGTSISLPQYDTTFITVTITSKLADRNADLTLGTVDVTAKGKCPSGTFYCPAASDSCGDDNYCPVVSVAVGYVFQHELITTMLEKNVTVEPTFELFKDSKRETTCSYDDGCKFNGGDVIYFRLGLKQTDHSIVDYFNTALQDMAICGDYDATITSCITQGSSLDYWEKIVTDKKTEDNAAYLEFTSSTNKNVIDGQLKIPDSIRVATLYLEFVIETIINFPTGRRRRMLLQAGDGVTDYEQGGDTLGLNLAAAADENQNTDAANSVHLISVVIVNIFAFFYMQM